MKFTLTLNRAHKVVERLKEERNRLKAEVMELSTPKSITLLTGMASGKVVAEYASSDAVIDKLMQLQEISLAISELKAKLAVVNTQFTISDRLCLNEVYAYNIQIIMNVINKALSVKNEKEDKYRYGKDESTPVDIGQLGGMIDALNKDPESKQFDIKVNRLGMAAVDELKKTLEDLKQQSFKVMDEVNDLNQTRIEFEIPETLISMSGLGALKQ